MVDTSALLDWLLERDTNRTKLVDSLLADAEQLHVADMVMVELAFALEKFYDLPRDTVSMNINRVLDEPVFNCSRALFHKAVSEYTEHPALSFLDCCLLNYAELQSILPVWTFDKKLINQSSGRAKSLESRR